MIGVWFLVKIYIYGMKMEDEEWETRLERLLVISH